jgi:hypothetical protein
VTYYTLFVIDLASRRVQIVGSTPPTSAKYVTCDTPDTDVTSIIAKIFS